MSVNAVPSQVDQGSQEMIPWGFDTTSYLDVGDVISLPTATLVNLTTGKSYNNGLSGYPSISGNTIIQTVANLLAGNSYRLVITFSKNSSEIVSIVLLIKCEH